MHPLTFKRQNPDKNDFLALAKLIFRILEDSLTRAFYFAIIISVSVDSGKTYFFRVFSGTTRSLTLKKIPNRGGKEEKDEE